MPAIHKIPKEVEKAFGEEGTEKFIQFLNETFEDQKKDTIEVVSDRFHRHVTEEASKVRLEVANIRTELKEDIGRLDIKISALRAEFKSDMADVQKSIALQTRWILAALLAAAVIYPIAVKLMDRLLP